MDNGRQDKKPWDKWYWQDYLSDTGLAACSLAAQGLWMRMLAIMARSKKKGYLLDGNQNMTMEILARLVGSTIQEVKPLLEELKQHEVFSISDDGIIYNRRMVREAEISEKRAEAGKIGGLSKKQKSSKSQANTLARSASASASAYASVSEYASDERIEERKSEGKKEGKQEEEKLIGDIIAKWNTFAQEQGLAKVDFIRPGTTRYQKLKTRLKEKEFDFDAILKEIERSDFLKGASSNWRVTFDWIICPNNYPKVLEGQYRNKGAGYMTDEELVAEYERSKKAKEQKNGELL